MEEKTDETRSAAANSPRDDEEIREHASRDTGRLHAGEVTDIADD